jgi:hypothetical protein
MERLYYVNTGNRFNQVLVFESFNKAFSWCKSATTWNEEEIKKNIIITEKNNNNYFNVFSVGE